MTLQLAPPVLQRRDRLAFRTCPVCTGSGVEITESRNAPINWSGVQGRVEIVSSRPNPDFRFPDHPWPTLYTLRRYCTCCGGKGTRPADPEPAPFERARLRQPQLLLTVERCEECHGTGVYESWVDGYGDAPSECIFCDGTGRANAVQAVAA